MKYAIALILMTNSAMAYTSTSCRWIGSQYVCTTTGSGGFSTTTCRQIGNQVVCTSY